MNEEMKQMIYRLGVVGTMELLIEELRRRAEHYNPTPSTFSTWADTIDAHLGDMAHEANELLYKGPVNA